MGDIIVDTYKLKQYAQKIYKVSSRMSQLEDRINDLYFETGLKDLYKLIQSDVFSKNNRKLLSCRNYLQQTAIDFENAEKRISSQDTKLQKQNAIFNIWFDNILQNIRWKDPNIKISQKQMRILLGSAIIGFGTVESALNLLSDESQKSFWAGTLEYTKTGSVWNKSSQNGETVFSVLKGEHTQSLKPEYGTYKDKESLGEKLNINIDQDKKEKYQENSDKSWYKEPKGTVLSVGAEEKVEGSVLDLSDNKDTEYTKREGKAKVLTSEAHAESEVGLYIYSKDEDGNVQKILSPGVAAEVGVSVAVVDVEYEGRLGLGEDKNMLGIYGEIDAEVLSAEAKAGVSLNRKEIYAGASAEADLAKVEAAGGVSVLGTDIGVSGSLKVGIGAHAEVGFTDGKFKVDVGAAVGVGFDLGFEVDVSGTVDAVCDAASSAWEGVKDTWGDVKDAWNSLF